MCLGGLCGSSLLYDCCQACAPPIKPEPGESERQSALLGPIPGRVGWFLFLQGQSYAGAGVVVMLWPAWATQMMLRAGLGGPAAAAAAAAAMADSGSDSVSGSLSAAEAGMSRLTSVFLIGIGWFYMHGGLSKRLHFLAATCLNRVVVVPFAAAVLAILGARAHFCAAFGVMDPVLALLTYLVLLGGKGACGFCFKLLLPTLVLLAAAVAAVVAATAAATVYDTTAAEWLTVRVCAIAFASAAVISLCLSSLPCVAPVDSTSSGGGGGGGGISVVVSGESGGVGDDAAPSRQQAAGGGGGAAAVAAGEGDGDDISSVGETSPALFEGTVPIAAIAASNTGEAAGLKAGQVHPSPVAPAAQRQSGTPGPAKPQPQPQRPEALGPTAVAGAAAAAADVGEWESQQQRLQQEKQRQRQERRRQRQRQQPTDSVQPSMTLAPDAGGGGDDDDEEEEEEDEDDVQLFETPTPIRTSSSGIFSPPPHPADRRATPAAAAAAQAAGVAEVGDEEVLRAEDEEEAAVQPGHENGAMARTTTSNFI